MRIINPQLAALKDRFVSGLPARLTRMRDLLAVHASDPAALGTLQREAHSLVGAAGIHGLSEVAQAASRLNQALVQQQLDDIASLLEALAQVIDAPDAPPDETTQGGPQREHQRIVIVMEGADERESSQALFESAGFHVKAVSTLADGLTACEGDQAPDLVLMGLQFLSDAYAGLSLLKTVRGRWPATPCLVTTALRAPTTLHQAHAAGAAHVLCKPIDPDDLLQHALQQLAFRREPPRVLGFSAPTTENGPAPQTPWPSWKNVASVDDLVGRSEQNPPDALVLTVTHDHDALCELTQVLADHPNTRGLPLLWLGSTVIPELWVKGITLGAVAWLDVSLSSESLQVAVATHARRARLNGHRSQRLQSLLYEVNRQRTALDQHTIVSLANATGHVIETSANHVRLTGHPLDQLLGSHLAEPRDHKAPPELPTSAWNQALQGEVWQGQIELTRPDGSRRWAEATLVPFLNPQGKPYQFLLARTDVTSRVETEAALVSARKAEMETAGIIQKTLLVPPLPLAVGGAEIAARFAASSGLAGDFHELIDLGNQCFDVVLGDVMGKGMPAALIAAGLKLELSRCLSEVVDEVISDIDTKIDPKIDTKAANDVSGEVEAGAPRTRHEPAHIVKALDTKLTPKLIALGSFVTLSYLRFDLKQGTLTSVGCGHPETMLLHGADTEYIPNLNMPIGILAGEDYSQSTHNLPPGSTVVLYSDGLSEAINAQGEEFGAEGILRAVETPHQNHWGARACAAAIMSTLNNYTGGGALKDDRTMVVIGTPVHRETLLALPRDVQSLAPLRQRIVQFAREQAIDERDLDAIQLASVEAFSNVVKHARSNDDETAVMVSLRRAESTMLITLSDLSEPFVPPEHPSMPEPEELALGGYGLGLLQALCLDIHYWAEHGVNRCQLTLACPHSPIIAATSE